LKRHAWCALAAGAALMLAPACAYEDRTEPSLVEDPAAPGVGGSGEAWDDERGEGATPEERDDSGRWKGSAPGWTTGGEEVEPERVPEAEQERPAAEEP
jgi:hypothetical protein